MQQTKNDANDGYFVEPASHAAGTTYGAPSVEGMRVRLKSSFNISGYSAINQAILTAFQQYGMIMADNGGYFFIQGATDSRWNDSDLANLAGIPSSDFDGHPDDSLIPRLGFRNGANRSRAGDQQLYRIAANRILRDLRSPSTSA